MQAKANGTNIWSRKVRTVKEFEKIVIALPVYPPHATGADVMFMWSSWLVDAAEKVRELNARIEALLCESIDQMYEARKNAECERGTLADAQKALDAWNERNGGGQ